MQIFKPGSSKDGQLKPKRNMVDKIVTFPPLNVSDNVLLI